jgi:hypothetical protein
MPRAHALFIPAIFCLLALPLSAFDALNQEQVKLLQDSGGWEYTKLSDDTSGFPTAHTCFDGTAHPSSCSGTMTLDTDKKFIMNVNIEGQSVSRHGDYNLDGDQLAFFDEFGNRDGPYTVEIDTKEKTMVLHMPQIRMELTLEKEYRRKKK